jgi:hypothetical protein
MRRRQACYGLSITVIICSLTLSAAAEVRWQAPAGCPTQIDVERSLSRLANDSAERLSVHAAVEREETGYHLRLQVRGEGRSFERELQAEACDVLVDTMVFLVELAGAQLAAAAKEHPAEEPELVSTSVPETVHQQPADAASGSSRTTLRLGAGASMIEAGLSGVSPHLALDLSLGLASWSVGLRLGALLHPVLRLADGAQVDLQTNAAQLLGCRYWDVASVLIGPCIALSALRTTARSTGLTGSDTRSANWLASGPALSLQVRLAGALLMGIEIGAWAALSPRPSFEVAGTTVARAGTLAGYARLGAAYEMW